MAIQAQIIYRLLFNFDTLQGVKLEACNKEQKIDAIFLYKKCFRNNPNIMHISHCHS